MVTPNSIIHYYMLLYVIVILKKYFLS